MKANTNTVSAPTYTIANRKRGTHWKVGIEVIRISGWDREGFALFTLAPDHPCGPTASIHAHRSEVVAS